MIRQHLITPHPERDGDFRWRGDGVSRIEGLSDAVFGFAITLLVVSLGAPRTYDDLVRMMVGFPAFVGTFALLVMIWLAQYKFFRRYGLEDATTVRLNVVLLCVVVFFVYPLKFLFETFIGLWLGPVGWLTGAQPLVAQARAAQAALRPAEWPAVMLVFAIGYAAVFGVFALLHRHALRQADALDLDALERLDTRFAVREHTVNVAIAVTSVLVTYGVARLPAAGGAIPRGFFGAEGFGAMLGGFVYMATGPVMYLVGRGHRRRRRALVAARASRRDEPPGVALPAGAGPVPSAAPAATLAPSPRPSTSASASASTLRPTDSSRSVP